MTLRKSLQLSQSEFGTRIGLSRAAYSMYESEKANPEKLVDKLQAKLGVDPTWYLTGEGSMFIGEAPHQVLSEPHTPYGADAAPGFPERLKQARKALGYNQHEAAAICNIARMTFSRYEKGETLPSPLYQKTIAQALRVDVDWLMQGTGKGPVGNGIMAPASQFEYITLPMLSYSAAATFDAIKFFESESGEDYEGQSFTIYKQPGTDYRNAVVITIEGNSMEPKFPAGSKVVAVPMAQPSWEYASGYVAVSLKAEVFMFKRVKATSSTSITLMSENPSFPEEREITLDSINVMWKVLHLVYAPI